MTEKPILFSTEMIGQILAGNKTQTRRIIKNPPTCLHTYLKPLGPTAPTDPTMRGDKPGVWTIAGPDYPDAEKDHRRCPYWADQLWAREAHAIVPRTAYASSTDDGKNQLPHRVSPDGLDWAVYRQGWTRCKPAKWRPSIHMPRWACRLVLDVKSIRAERLQDITEKDARAEGVEPFPFDPEGDCWTDGKHRTAFEHAWNEMHGWAPNSWAVNPWVWVVSFEVADA